MARSSSESGSTDHFQQAAETSSSATRYLWRPAVSLRYSMSAHERRKAVTGSVEGGEQACHGVKVRERRSEGGCESKLSARGVYTSHVTLVKSTLML